MTVLKTDQLKSKPCTESRLKAESGAAFKFLSNPKSFNNMRNKNAVTTQRLQPWAYALAVSLLALSLLFATPAQAQVEQGDIRASPGIAYGTQVAMGDNELTGGIGLTPALEYVFVDNASINLSYDFFFESKKGDRKLQWSYLNVDFRSYLPLESVQLYVLTGVSSMKSTRTFTQSGGRFPASSTTTTEKSSVTNLGVNLGAGAIFQLVDNIGGNVQVKYATHREEFVFNVGVVYSF